MTTSQQSGTDLDTHLQRALATAKDSETKYHLREALQKRHAQRSAEVGSAATLDD